MEQQLTIKTKPSIVRIVQSDMIAMWAVLAPVICFGLYIAITYFGFAPTTRSGTAITGDSGSPFFLYATIITLLVSVPLLVARIKGVNDTFDKGVAVQGEVINLSFHRDRGRVEYLYLYEGQQYQGSNAIMKNGRTQALVPGTPITLIVEPQKPQRALIRDLYI